MTCEYCGKEHDGSFGSGRFCSDTCRRAFCGSSSKSGKRKIGYTRKDTKKGGWTCICSLNFRTRAELRNHRQICDIWCNKPKQHINQYIKAELLGLPKPEVSEETRKKLSLASSGNRNPSTRTEVREKISASMKKAHSEGRAHNIGECRWNNEPSYPEQWFMKVLKNEFGLEKDKDYIMELPFHRFSLDFAWPDKKFCIEIDGEQHERFQEQKNMDIEKDKLLKEEGWKELRKSWKEIFNNPKAFIEEVKICLGGYDGGVASVCKTDT